METGTEFAIRELAKRPESMGPGGQLCPGLAAGGVLTAFSIRSYRTGAFFRGRTVLTMTIKQYRAIR